MKAKAILTKNKTLIFNSQRQLTPASASEGQFSISQCFKSKDGYFLSRQMRFRRGSLMGSITHKVRGDSDEDPGCLHNHPAVHLLTPQPGSCSARPCCSQSVSPRMTRADPA